MVWALHIVTSSRRICCIPPMTLLGLLYVSWVMSPICHESCLLYVMSHVSYMSCVMSPICHASCLLYVISHVSYMPWVMSPIWHASCLLYAMSHVSYMAWVMSPICHEACLLYVMSHAMSYMSWVMSPMCHESCLLYVMSHVSHIEKDFGLALCQHRPSTRQMTPILRQKRTFPWKKRPIMCPKKPTNAIIPIRRHLL